MPQCYIEQRQNPTKPSALPADIMRHLYTRQNLGKAVIICDEPANLLSVGRKHWLKLSRLLQRQRSGTLDADKILKYTHAITRMQHMGFSARAPLNNPEAAIYFLRPDELEIMPMYCWTVYVTAQLGLGRARGLLAQLPAEALVVDYASEFDWQSELGLKPKKDLEKRVARQWRNVQKFLEVYRVSPAVLKTDDVRGVEIMDDALDTLLGASHQFLRVADDFHRALELARPLRLTKEQRLAYDSLILLAHRVQALSPGAFTHQFLETYNEDDTFFLYDPGRGRLVYGGETLAEVIARHQAAGRHNLAAALHKLACPMDLTPNR